MQDQTRILHITPEPENRAELTDAELVASYAREALQLGRYPLGAELARLADRAARVGARPAGHDAAALAMFGPAMANVPMVGQTRTEAPRDAISHAPQVCTFRSEVNGSGQLCHQPVAWHPGSVGDAIALATTAGWYHLDPAITDHEPVVAGY